MSRRKILPTHDWSGWGAALADLGGLLDRVDSSGALRATTTLDTFGELGGEWQDLLLLLDRAGLVTGAVYSYQTPIAVRVFCADEVGRWFIIPEHYSVTTSRHQNVIENATGAWRKGLTPHLVLEVLTGDPDIAAAAGLIWHLWRWPATDLLDTLREIKDAHGPGGLDVLTTLLGDGVSLSDAVKATKGVLS